VHSSRSSALTESSSQREFRGLVRSLSAKELTARFPEEYKCFRAMVGRAKYHQATVHREVSSFKGFLLALGEPRPAPEWTVDRINPSDPEYAPGKIRWADKRQQANNRTNTKWLTHQGQTRPLADWARLKNQSPATLRKRLSRGWTHDEVITGVRGAACLPSAEAPAASPHHPVGWPPTCQAPQKWEKQYQRWMREFRSPPHVTRAVFYAWINGNRLRKTKHALQQWRPDYFSADGPAPDDETELPSEVTENAGYRSVLAAEITQQWALSQISRSEQQLIALKGLRHSWGGVLDPDTMKRPKRR
jgi:hypothetical protein